MKTQTINIRLDLLRIETQARVKTHDMVVREYSERMRDGDTFPAVKVAPDGQGGYYVIDGNHRVLAAKSAGLTELACIVMQTSGDPKEFALCQAAACNTDHGAPRSPEDKRKAIRIRIDEYRRNHATDGGGLGLNISKIARELKVSRDLVADVAHGMGVESASEKAELARLRVADRIIEDPDRSNTAIADMEGVSEATVRNVRARLAKQEQQEPSVEFEFHGPVEAEPDDEQDALDAISASAKKWIDNNRPAEEYGEDDEFDCMVPPAKTAAKKRNRPEPKWLSKNGPRYWATRDKIAFDDNDDEFAIVDKITAFTWERENFVYDLVTKYLLRQAEFKLDEKEVEDIVTRSYGADIWRYEVLIQRLEKILRILKND